MSRGFIQGSAIALGITLSGEKRFLGFVETDTENAPVLTLFLRALVERGLDLSQGVLVILDGGKGLFPRRALNWPDAASITTGLGATQDLRHGLLDIPSS